MNRINIYRNTYKEQTAISNVFIDEFMAEANDAQLKIYLFLIRMMSANLPTSVCDIADKFNYTEKDVLRALSFWESRQLLSLDYDAAGNLCGIQVLSLDDPHHTDVMHSSAINGTNMHTSSINGAKAYAAGSRIKPVLSFVKPSYDLLGQPPKATAPNSEAFIAPSPKEASAQVRPSYTMDEIRNFKEDEEAGQLLFVAEQYFGRPLTRSDIETLLFIYDKLEMSIDLIDYLIQHCIERGKKDIRYIEKVALAWSEQGITTPDQAKASSKGYDKTVYTIMQSLGKYSTPAPKELEYITKWTTEYGFMMDVIQEACDKTVIATDKNRFAYADGILGRWYKAGVHHKSDIPVMDTTKPAANTNQNSQGPRPNQFNRFEQNNYDFDNLEASLLSN